MRYIAIAGPDATHRLAVRTDSMRGELCCSIAPDRHAGLRLAAAELLLRHLTGARPRSYAVPLRPTRFQHRRLALLLAILDRLDRPGGPRATVLEVAGELVFRNLRPEGALIWKTSSQRRQTQRLIAEARRMANGGYRALLIGKMLEPRD